MAEATEKLTPEQLNAFALRCVVCGKDVPKNRATRRKDTCSVECYDHLKQWRKHLQNSRRCQSCLAPYTERQRAEFRLWRQETGSLRVKRGRPPLALEKKLAEALEAVTMAQSWEEAREIAENAIRKPVDTAPPESNSISADHATI